ncbi:MAG: DNA-processing protein DprA [Candidatus Aminicenantes bacterium]|nr:DNA-processing protein DprA [Candidatus Aminicenantes bacterium]
MDERRLSWLALNLALWDNLKLLQKVLSRFPSPREAFRAPEAELTSLGFDADRAERLRSPAFMERAHKEFDRLQQKGYSLVTFGDTEYPADLKEIFDPPCVLYVQGRAEVLQGPAVAIVGTRKPSPYGRAVAERLAEDLSSRGVVVVSGLALGIDSAAHWGALKGGRTVAVLGSGLDNIYPRVNRKLVDKLAERGAALSEFPLDTDPFAANFPRRNRIISGLARAVVVVEAAERSGSLITAGFALDQGREVMAVPGNVTSDMSRGSNGLIKKGAKLVESWEDVAEELGSPLRETLLAQKEGETRPLPLMTDSEAAVYHWLKPDELTHIDELVEKGSLSASELLVLLLALEIKGLVRQSPGMNYQRRI